MKQKIIAKATFLHGQAGKYEEMLKEGKKIEGDVVLKDTGAFIEASIGGDVIGNVVTEGYEIPKVYTATLEGLGDEPKSFLISVDTEAKASGGDFESRRDEVVKKGFHVDDVDRRIDYMTEEGFHPSVIVAVLKFLSEHGNPEESIMIEGCDPVFRKTGDISPIMKMCMAACTQSALILFGEKSTGKNVASHTAAWLLGQPEYRIGFQRDMGIDDAFGGKGTDNSAAEALDEELATAYVLYNADPAANANFASEAGKFELLKAQAASIRVVQNKSALLKWAAEGGVMMFDGATCSATSQLADEMRQL